MKQAWQLNLSIRNVSTVLSTNVIVIRISADSVDISGHQRPKMERNVCAQQHHGKFCCAEFFFATEFDEFSILGQNG